MATETSPTPPTSSETTPTAQEMPPTEALGGARPWRLAVVLGLIIFVGINLRSVLLAVPPILPVLHSALGLSYSETGLLTSLPVLLMGGAALPAGLLAGRLGARGTVALGLALLAAGTALRAVWPNLLALYAFTALLSLGIAFAQTAMPVLTRQWFPTRIGLVSALFSDGLIFGETLAAVLTGPVILGWLGKDAWASTFLVWSVPVVAAFVLWLWLAPAAAATRPVVHALTASHAPAPQAGPRRARVSAWHLGVMLGSGSLIFFGMNGWIASYNQALGRGGATPLALGLMNAAQLPVSLSATVFADRLAGRRMPFIVTGVICLVAVIGWVASPAALEPLWVSLLGGSSALVFTLGLALPPLLAGREDVARLAGATLTISYGFAFLGPLIGGSLWDLSHIPALAFAPVGLAGLTLAVCGALLPRREAFGLLGAEVVSATS